MGLVYLKAESPYIERIRPIIEKKARLGADCWGNLDTGIRHVVEPIDKLLQKEFPNYNPFPMGIKWQIKYSSCSIKT